MVSIRPLNKKSEILTPYWSNASDRVAVVVNGNAKGVTDDLVRILDQIVKSGDLFVSRNMVEGRDIARIIAERGYRTVLTGGGDGTFVQMVSWIVQISRSKQCTPPKFGLLKLGTGNALAWVLGAQRQGKKEIIADLSRLLMNENSQSIRLIQVEDLLTPFGGIGADAIALNHYNQVKEFTQRVKLLRPLSTGAATYATALILRTAPELTFSQPLTVRIINQGGPAWRMGKDSKPEKDPIGENQIIYEGPMRMIGFSTIPYWGFGARVFPHADIQEGRFNLRVANIGPMSAIMNIRSIWKGTFRHHRLVDFLVEKIAIHCDTPAYLEVGGDVLGRRTIVQATLSRHPIQLVNYYS